MTSIEWTDATWNPTTGCTRVSAGCDHCYAVPMTRRLAGMGQKKYQGLVGKGHFNGVVKCHEDALKIPLRWRKPRRVFVNSMSDLFHPAVPFDFIDKVFAVMALCPQHTFQVLTKRPERMAEYLSDPDRVIDGIADAWLQHVGRYLGPLRSEVEDWCAKSGVSMATRDRRVDAINAHTERWYRRENRFDHRENPSLWALPNVWLGTSVEDQEQYQRVGELAICPAVVRFISYEPALGPLNLGCTCWLSDNTIEHEGRRYCRNCRLWADWRSHIHWLIVGGESGPGARPCDIGWIRSIRDQCEAAGVPCFVKQLGNAQPYLHTELGRGRHLQDGDDTYLIRDSKGGDMAEWPEDLRVREWPAVATAEVV